jgi:hypothetical protein
VFGVKRNCDITLIFSASGRRYKNSEYPTAISANVYDDHRETLLYHGCDEPPEISTGTQFLRPAMMQSRSAELFLNSTSSQTLATTITTTTTNTVKLAGCRSSSSGLGTFWFLCRSHYQYHTASITSPINCSVVPVIFHNKMLIDIVTQVVCLDLTFSFALILATPCLFLRAPVQFDPGLQRLNFSRSLPCWAL